MESKLVGSKEIVRGDKESVFVECSYIVDDDGEELINVRFSVLDDDGESDCEIAANLTVDRAAQRFSKVTFEGTPERMI